MFSFRSQFKRSRRNYPIPKKTGINDILSALFQNNEQGLIYHIGDFDRYMSELGPNSVVNGGFDNGLTGWTAKADVIVDGGRAKCFATKAAYNAVLRQTQPFNGAGWYRIRGNVQNVSMQTWCQLQARAAADSSFIASSTSFLHPAGAVVQADFSFYANAPFYINFLIDINVNDPSRIAYVDNIRCEKLTAINTATLFQDAAGTIPVTAVEQPVGLILDKRLHRFDGSLAWTKTLGDGAVTVNGGLITITGATTETRVNAPGRAMFNGMAYMRVRYVNTGSATSPLIWISGAPTVPVSGQTYLLSLFSSNSSLERVQIASGNATFEILEYYFLPGNHASQPTTTARAVLRARYNLLTYSEDFSNPAWIKSGSPTLTNLGEGVWRLQANAGSSWLLYQNIPRPNTETCQFSIEVKSNGSGLDAFRTMLKGIVTQNFAAAEGWTRIVVTGLNDGSGSVGIIHRDNAAIDILIRFPDLRPANLPSGLPSYQRIAAATDYDTAGFPVYLDPDGTDDSYVTGSIDFTATDKMTIWAGLRKVDDAERMLCELSTSWAANTGGFSLQTGPSNVSYFSGSRATTIASVNQGGRFNSGLYPAPDSAVITAQHDIAGDLSRIRRNGSSAGAIDGTGDKGEGNFGNYPLYLFSRGGTSLRFKGPFYSLVIRGAATDTETIEKMEQVINSVMKGVY